jgi:hypothetical protein
VRPAIDFKIIRLARVRFEFEIPDLEANESSGWRNKAIRNRYTTQYFATVTGNATLSAENDRHTARHVHC